MKSNEKTNTIESTYKIKDSTKRKFQVLKTAGKVENIPVQAIVDTGSTITIISNQLKNKLTNYKPIEEELQNITIKAANGEPLEYIEKIQVPIEICNQEYIHDVAIVKNFQFDLLLGNDFLYKASIIIDFPNATIKSKESNAPITIQKEETWITIHEDKIIPSRSEMILNLNLSQDMINQNTLMIFEPVQNIPENKNILLARCLVTPKMKTIPIRICNPSLDEVKLYSKTRIGTLEPCEFLGNIDASSKILKTQQKEIPNNINLEDSELTIDQKEKLLKLLKKYSNIFAEDPKNPGTTNQVFHHINTKKHQPINQPSYRTGPKEDETINKEVKEMLKNQVIQPSTSPWSSPIVLVKKKDGKLRFCVNYRKLNTITEKDVYPLPRIDDTIDTLAGATYFSTLDLASGYWQIPVANEDRPKTAFKTKKGLFEFKVMPFGLCNAPATFQRVMDRLLIGLKWNFCLVYLDDIVIFSKTFEKHIEHLEEVFKRIQNANFHLKAEKCVFGRKEIIYLGYSISKEGIKPEPSKLTAIQSIKAPSKIKQLQQFLGLCSYYRRFIKNFAQIAEPLNQLLRKSIKFEWLEKHQKAFEDLKNKLQKPPILALPNFQKQFFINTDASNISSKNKQ